MAGIERIELRAEPKRVERIREAARMVTSLRLSGTRVPWIACGSGAVEVEPARH